MAAADIIERLQRYLRALSPQAQSMLVGALERSVLRGDDVAGGDLIFQELRRIAREQRDGAPRIGNSARLFFKPIESFLVDDKSDHKHPGRIARCSLEPLWNWVRRDLLPDDAKVLADQVGEALLANDEARAEHAMRAFQDRAVGAIAANFNLAAGDDKSQRRLLAQIGTGRASEDATILRCLLKGHDALGKLAAHLPIQIADLSNGRLDECKGLIESTSAQDGDLFLSALLMVMSRLAAPWQLIRFGIKAAGSDTAARVAETHYSVGVTIVLAELDRQVRELRDGLHDGRGVAVSALLKTIHDAVRALRTELAIPVDSTWGRALAAQRAQISELLKSEIESMPGKVRRLLRARPSDEIRPHSTLDDGDVADTEALVEFMGSCRRFADELAISEMTQRTFAELQQYLDGGMRALLDGLRHAGPSDRSFRQSQVDAAVRFCAKVFGPDYASLLGKAAEVAGAAERKIGRTTARA
ncbi:MAG TPA: hypothetical protein VHV56_08985 [Pseudolabrys sp.]|jgi:hypothetical protein|nr:hypothetical protein [Pseudolabrys sp.]